MGERHLADRQCAHEGVAARDQNIRGRLMTQLGSSIQYEYYDKPESAITKAAFSFTFDADCESGGGANCAGGASDPSSPSMHGSLRPRSFVPC
jgi:hypothetical protein